MNGSLVQLALRRLRAVLSSRVMRFGLLIAVFVLTVSGPFGTFQSFNLGQRLAYWAVMVLATFLSGQVAAAMLFAVLGPRIAQRWPLNIVVGLLTGLPVTAVVLVVNGLAYQGFDWGTVLPMWLYATLITLVIVAGLTTLSDRLAATDAGTAPTVAAVPAPPPILERVPLPQRGRLLALLVEDHYVDIVTDRGKALVLMRLADAMRETEGVAGLQIHRSHWVARDAVVKALRSEGRLVLELSNGMRLPVSRGFLPQVKGAGFMP